MMRMIPLMIQPVCATTLTSDALIYRITQIWWPVSKWRNITSWFWWAWTSRARTSSLASSKSMRSLIIVMSIKIQTWISFIPRLQFILMHLRKKILRGQWSRITISCLTPLVITFTGLDTLPLDPASKSRLKTTLVYSIHNKNCMLGSSLIKRRQLSKSIELKNRFT